MLIDEADNSNIADDSIQWWHLKYADNLDAYNVR